MEDEKHAKDAQIKEMQEYVLRTEIFIYHIFKDIIFPAVLKIDCFLVQCLPNRYYCRKTKDSTAKLTQLKRNQQTEKKNSAQMLEEARQRENQMTEDMTKLQVYYQANSRVDLKGILPWLESSARMNLSGCKFKCSALHRQLVCF